MKLATLNAVQPQLRLTFLGTGTSQGVPMIRCDCAVCRSIDPRDNRTRASIYLETPEGSYVVDTGTDFRTQCLRENIWQVDAVIMTHSHTDHVMGFDDLRRFAAPRGGRIPIYASAETMADLERVFAFAFNGTNPWPGYLKPEPHIICGPFSLGQTTITPLPVPHGHSETYGYLFAREGVKLLAYLSDCSAVPDDVARKIEGVRLLVIDALRPKPHPTHLSIGQALEVALRVRPGRTLFTHICHELPQSAESTLPPGAGLAYDGLKIDFEK
ncbi:MAG: MBL fold metallo-hydrolase [Verrucomicrobiota bacterium]|nr:MBL fold metallo-hydrolase [Verrucomicrobiota bacterium]